MRNCQECGHPIRRHKNGKCSVVIEKNPYESWQCRCTGLPEGLRQKLALMRLPLAKRREIMARQATAVLCEYTTPEAIAERKEWGV